MSCDATQIVAPTIRRRGHSLQEYRKPVGGPDPILFRAWRCKCGEEYGTMRREVPGLHRAHVEALPPRAPKGKATPERMHLTPQVTLAESKAWLKARLADGAECPCCRQFAKVYQRRLHRGMARVLIAMYREAGREWLYLPDFIKTITGAGRDESFLAFWRLIEESKEPRADGGRAGWWRVTAFGEQFVRREITLPKIVNVYDDRAVHLPGRTTFEGPQIDIVEALTARFDYAQLMGIAL